MLLYIYIYAHKIAQSDQYIKITKTERYKYVSDYIMHP